MTAAEKCQHGPMPTANQVTWQVWAPFAQRVELMLISAGGPRWIDMNAGNGGWHFVTTDAVEDGQRYAFRLDDARVRPDPASRWQPDGVHQPSAFFRPYDFQWSDDTWRGIANSDLVFYELHVGTFTPRGTFDAMVARLPELCDLGVTALELMPVSQYPGERGWGYDGVHPFAAQNTYGGPRGLQRLVDACHRHGLAVFLDVVYNHFGPEGSYFAEFGPYFTDHHRTPWGSALNFSDRGCDAVRQFVLENARYWLHDFHFDGLRVDAVHALFDASPTHILRDLQLVAEEIADLQDRPIQIIAESNLNDVRLLRSAECGGYGLAGQWSDDFHHCVHTLLTGERDGYYSDFGQPEQLVKSLNDTFVYDGRFSRFHNRRHGAPSEGLPGNRFVVSIQNHDQVGNRALGDRFGTLLTPAQQRLAAGVLLLSPFLPLLFMGEEYGEENPWPFFCSFSDDILIEAVRRGRRAEFADFRWPDSLPDPQAESTFESARLHWDWPEGSWHAGLRTWYRELLQLRRESAPLRDCGPRHAQWYEQVGAQLRSTEIARASPDGVLELLRGDTLCVESDLIAAYFNFSNRPQRLSGVTIDRPAKSNWVLLLSSEWPKFGGQHPNTRCPTRADHSWRLLPYEVLVLSSVSR